MAGLKLLTRSILLAALFGGFAGLLRPESAGAQRVVSKSCSACGQDVPITARVGRTCPYCGAYWGWESSRYVPGGGPSGGRCPNYHFRPRNSLERMAFYQAMVQQQMIQHEMLRQQTIRQQREERRQRTAQRAQTLREQEEASRERLRERLRENSGLTGRNDDPQQRAERYVTTAARFEDAGDFDAAIAMYRLAVQSAPDSIASVHASIALSRLGVE